MGREKPAKQARSRATAERLLSAAIRVIAEHGLEGTTVPRIAKIAKVAPASVYRRYADKDALIRAAFLHLLEQSNQKNREMQEKKHLLGKNLEATVKQVVQALFDQYHECPLLMRSLTRYLQTTPDRDFVERVHSVIASNLGLVVQLLMVHRAEINWPAPEHALRFALLNAASSIEAYALDVNSLSLLFGGQTPRDRVA
jgi:AcrR family transcriptional regulator